MNTLTYLKLTNIIPAHPTANEPCDGDTLYRFSFGAYGETTVEVSADSDEDAFEVAVEWLDDAAPGHLVTDDEMSEAFKAMKARYPDASDEELQELCEVDLTIVGHTTLKNGAYLRSWEWTFDVVGHES
jgi:hypothetical protein